MSYLSMPLESNLEYNFWTAQIIRMQINLFQREEKFTQLVHNNSPIMASRRSMFLNKKIASQLILAAFDVGPQSVQGSEENDQSEEADYKRDKSDFNKQWNTIKDDSSLEYRVKRFLFQDVHDFLTVHSK